VKHPSAIELGDDDPGEAWALSGDEAVEVSDEDEKGLEEEEADVGCPLPAGDVGGLVDSDAGSLFAHSDVDDDVDDLVQDVDALVPPDADEAIEEVVLELVVGCDLHAPSASAASSSDSAVPGALVRSAKTLRVPVKGGVLIYNIEGQVLCAQCKGRGHGKCFLTRAMRVSPLNHRAFQGWPVAGCLEWLAMDLPDCTGPEHVRLHLPGTAARQRRRDQTVDDPVLSELYSKEARWRLDEPDAF
jgi:hypothetical protein